MEQGKHYYAFISHSTKDEKIALWLCNKLDNYHIPTTVQKEYGAPKNLKPNFTFQTNLAGNKLRKALGNELDDSQYLIVVCSPDAAHSSYVNDEVQHFIDTGRTDKIIPFIIEGTPDDCFPPALLSLKGEDELRGVNLKETEKHLSSKMAAVVNVIATMLGVRFDVLWDKYRRQRAKKNVILCAIALITISFGLFLWDYNRPTYRYFVDYVDCWGVPKGIIEVDESMFRHRSRTYRFEYRRIPIGKENALSWRLSQVEYINSAGLAQDHENFEINNRYAIQKLEYNSSTGALNHIDLCNKNGKVQLRWKFSGHNGEKASLIDFIGASDYEASSYLSSMSNWETLGLISKSSIKRYVLKRDSHGYIIEQSFHRNNDDDIESSKIADENGVYKQVFINDSLGRVKMTTNYDINEVVLQRKDGVAIREFEYDKNGTINQVKYYNSDQKPTLSSSLCARVVFKSDNWGNITKESYYGTEGRLCYNKDNVSIKVIEFDDKGFPVSIAFLDSNNLPCFNSDGVSKIIIKCDDRGNQIENKYENIHGKPCADKNGLAKIEMDYNRWGNPTYMAFYGMNGNLTCNETGIAGWTTKYDKFGNCTQCEFFDIEWNKSVDMYGNAGIKEDYDERGFMIKRTFFDVHEKESACNIGFSSCELVYNDRGNLKECSYYKNGLPCRVKNSFHKIVYDYDRYGNLSEYRYYDINGALCNSRNKFAICKATTDSAGNIIQWDYFDAFGHPTRNIEGVERYKCEFDAYGKITSVRFYNNEGQPILNNENVAGRSVKRDYRGNIIESYGVGLNGDVRCDKYGVARWEAKFNERGYQTFYATYDEKNNLVSLKNGVALWESEYNERGLLVKTSFYDENKKLCFNTDIGYSFLTAQYDERFNQIEECTYNEKKQLCNNPTKGFARWSAKYDNSDNIIEMSSYSEDRSLCMCKYGYARWIAKYDKDGNLEKSISYDADGNVISTIEESKELVYKDFKQYDPHRFRFDKTEVVFAFIFLLALLFFFIIWINNISTNTKWENIGWIAGFVLTLNICFHFLYNFLLHYKLMPYTIYNYSWILYTLSAIICVSTIVFFLVRIGTRIVSIYKAPKHSVLSFGNDRKQVFLESIGELFFQIVATAAFTIALSCLAYEGWLIYSNPL